MILIKILKKIYRKNERYIKTFIESFVGYIALHITTTNFSSKTALEALLLGAIASSISVVINKIDTQNS